jgi:ketosteroid isomerase-like protein
MLSDVAALLAKQACREVVLRAAEVVDAQDYNAFVALFTEDATLVRPGGAVLKGRAEILQAYLSKDPHRMTHHFICNHQVALPAADRAVSRCKVLLFASDQRRELTPKGRLADPQQMAGVIEDALVLTPEGWQIQHRQAWFELLIQE